MVDKNLDFKISVEKSVIQNVCRCLATNKCHYYIMFISRDAISVLLCGGFWY